MNKNMTPEEISALIKSQIASFKGEMAVNKVGTVISYGDGIATIYGLKQAMLGELLLFPHDILGMVMNLNLDTVSAVVLNGEELVKEGDTVKSTGRVVEVPVGDGLLGRVVNALGIPIDDVGPLTYEKTRPIERIAPGVMKRESVNEPLLTGIKAIDTMIPIGRGQRELIIGDRQTGKTSIAIDTIINQKDQNVKCIYVAIGQKNSSVATLTYKLKQAGALKYTVVVNASASDSAPELYIAPYAGMAIAEEWMEQGQDVLIVFDDLSKHAVSYRALSLLLRRSPGREAYPGDIFYLHSRLLERACKLSKEYGGGSITALPIIETQAGDISAYIPTNVISITDGQIFLITDYFTSGQRPAVDSGFSVSRVGSSAQHNAMKKVSKGLKISLANYRENLSFAQFGSDLDESTRKILHHGEVVMEALKQWNYKPLKEIDEILDIFIVQKGFFDDIDKKDVSQLLTDIKVYLHAGHQDLLDEIDKTHDLTDEMSEKLVDIITDYLKRKP